jgi:hypothetical protein
MEPLFVEVLKTNVQQSEDADLIRACLSSLFEPARITFDLEDIDCVLRVATHLPVNAEMVIYVVSLFGFRAEVMPDVVLRVNVTARNNCG